MFVIVLKSRRLPTPAVGYVEMPFPRIRTLNNKKAIKTTNYGAVVLEVGGKKYIFYSLCCWLV